MAQRILALDFDAGSIRAALAERSWNSFRLLRLLQDEIGEGEAGVPAALSRLVHEVGKPDVVVTTLPSQIVTKRLLALPFKDRRKLQQVVPFALEEHLPFPLEEVAVAFARVGEQGDKTLVLAAAVRKSDLREHLEMLAREGIDPKSVTLGPLALALLIARSRDGNRAPHLLLNVERSVASMVLIDAGSTVRAMRTVATAAGADHRGPSAPPVDAIVTGARQMLLAHSAEAEEAELVLTGSAPGIPALRNELAQSLALPIRELEDFRYQAWLSEPAGEVARFGTCLGMLLGEMPGKPAEVLNFRAREFAFKGRSYDVAPLYTSAILITTAVVMLAFHLILGFSTSFAELHRLDRRIVRALAPVTGGVSSPDLAVAEVKKRIAAMGKQIKLLGGVSPQSSPLDCLLALSKALPQEAKVEVEDLSFDGTSIKLSGKADSYASVDEVKKALSLDSYFSDVEVNETKTDVDPNKVDFRLSATVKDVLEAGE